MARIAMLGIGAGSLAMWHVKMKSLCPWKGVASYYTLEADGQQDRNAAWTYRHPSPLARRIKGHVAFWGSVEVTADR